MTSKIVLGAIVVIAFLAGTITTETLASAAPPENNPGQPFAVIMDMLDEIKDILNDANAGIADGLAAISGQVDMVKTETDKIQMLKDDQVTLQANLNLIDQRLCRIIQPYANLSGCNLTGLNLNGVDLTHADLSSVDLTDTDLTNTDLTRANLSGVDLSGVDLTTTDLSEVDLTGADLTGADLTNADIDNSILIDAILIDAILIGVDLPSSDLTGADLTGADFTNADIFGTDFSDTNLEDAIGAPFVGCIGHPLCE